MVVKLVQRISGCPRHKHCAYTGSEPGLCRMCHASERKCNGKHGGRPVDGWGEVKKAARASATHKALKEGQYIDPALAVKDSDGGAKPRESAQGRREATRCFAPAHQCECCAA